MNRKRFSSFPLALALALTMLAALGTRAFAQGLPSSSDPFTALPESDLIIVLDAQRILSDAVPRILANDQKTLLQMNTGIDGVKGLTGIDARAVRRVVFGTRNLSTNMKPQDFRGVVIVEGIDTEKLLGFARAAVKGKYTEETYGGSTVYTLTKASEPKLMFDVAAVALNSGMFAIGTPEELRASIDAFAGRGTRANPELVGSVSRHSSALVSLGFNIPPSLIPAIAASGSSEGGTNEMIGKALSTLKSFSAALGMTPAGYDMFVAARVESGEQAKSLSDMLTGLQKLALMEQPKTERDRMMMDLLKNVLISSQGTEVQLKTEVSQATVNQLMQSAKGGQPPPATKKPPVRRRTRRRR
ncbi:MAG TPA: hypothetical protein VGB73_19990 [Pyrinomonadaceae bacterium]|jgi:hypothetical protein